jgi:hypothetical protein
MCNLPAGWFPLVSRLPDHLMAQPAKTATNDLRVHGCLHVQVFPISPWPALNNAPEARA